MTWWQDTWNESTLTVLVVLGENPSGNQLSYLCRAEAAELSDLFSDRSNREMLQAVLGRSNPRYVTPADLDFNFPPDVSISQGCRCIIDAGHAWRNPRSCPALLSQSLLGCGILGLCFEI